MTKVARVHDMSLVFKTVIIRDKERLLAFVVLRRGQSTQSRMAPCFPNFLVACLPKQFSSGYDWLETITCDVDGPIFHDYTGHPYEGVKKALDYSPVSSPVSTVISDAWE